MKKHALITTAACALLIGVTLAGYSLAQDVLDNTLPSPASSATPRGGALPISSTAPAPSSVTATTPSTPSPATTTGSVPATTSTLPGASATGTMPTTSTSSTAPVIVPVTSTGASTLPGSGNLLNSTGSGLTGNTPIPSAVQDAVSRLQKVDQINLDDMVRAQDAINRLDLLLEIEKRQTELKKVRDERNKPAAALANAAAAANLLGSAIPASALNLPKVAVDVPAVTAPPPSTSFTSKHSSKKSEDDQPSGPSSKYSIKRITGTNGRYSAVINTDDNSAQTVHVGDKLPDGSVVKTIGLTNVSLIKDKKSKNLTIPTDSYIVRESGSSLQQ